MSKSTPLASCSNERAFIRQSLFSHKVRLDGRGCEDYRELDLRLDRTESTSSCELKIGDTYVVTVVSSQVVAPYPDRPIEGMIRFNTNILHNTGSTANHWEITRLIERAFKESDAIDTESLCIISGERVWQICIDMTVLDGSGGNVLDACFLSVISALRAFRKPDISIIPRNEVEDADHSNALPVSEGRPHSNKHLNILHSRSGDIVVHHSNDREPLPLPLHFSPIAVSLGVFRPTLDEVRQATGPGEIGSRNPVLVADLSVEELASADGDITFAVNAHRELCFIAKPAGAGMSAPDIMRAVALASKVATQLHDTMNRCLLALEDTVLKEREKQLVVLRRLQEIESRNQANRLASVSTAFVAEGIQVDDGASMEKRLQMAAGIHRSDPILEWSKLHQPAGLWE